MASYSAAFDEMTLSAHDGRTDITGPIVDSSHLHGRVEQIARPGPTLAQPHPGTLEGESQAVGRDRRGKVVDPGFDEPAIGANSPDAPERR